MSLDELRSLARAAAASHRLGMPGQGGEALARLVDALGPYLASRPGEAASLAPLLAEIVAAQTRADPVGLADRLEHELAPMLRS